MFYLIGLGLTLDDVSGRAIKAMKECSTLYMDNYTSLGIGSEKLAGVIGKKIIPVERAFLENKMDFILDEARAKEIGVLVQGDCLSATTHISLLLECVKKGIKYKVVHGVSILTAVGETGLSLYNFGKIGSIPFERKNLKAPYTLLKENLKQGMHTLLLLDLSPRENKYVSVPDAVKYLLEQGMEDINCVGCCRLGMDDSKIVFGKAKCVMKEKFDKFPQCLIIPGKTHFIEEEFLNEFKLN